MKSKDIVTKTMEKLNEHLIKFNKDNSKSFEEIIDFSRKMINKKYIDFQKNITIQENVKNKICSIFESKKIEAIDIANKVMIHCNSEQNIYTDGY